MESIISRRYISVKGLTSRHWSLPLLVISFQLVAKENLLRKRETESRVIDLYAVRVGRNPNRPVGLKRSVVGEQLLHTNRGRSKILVNMVRIHHLENAASRVPHFAVRSQGHRRLHVITSSGRARSIDRIKHRQ